MRKEKERKKNPPKKVHYIVRESALSIVNFTFYKNWISQPSDHEKVHNSLFLFLNIHVFIFKKWSVAIASFSFLSFNRIHAYKVLYCRTDDTYRVIEMS